MIHIQKLTKSFGTTQALKGIDLTVKQGEVHGFISPNGAGKSTAIRIPLGIKSLTVEPPSLEELFMRHYGDDICEKGGI